MGHFKEKARTAYQGCWTEKNKQPEDSIKKKTQTSWFEPIPENHGKPESSIMVFHKKHVHKSPFSLFQTHTNTRQKTMARPFWEKWEETSREEKENKS